MEYIQISGKNKEDAIYNAMMKLAVDDRDQLEIEVVEEGSKGFLLGIGAKDCIINVKKKPNEQDIVKNFLEKIFLTLGVAPELDIYYQDDNLRVDIKGNDAAILIGKRGESLDSLQFLTNIVVNKQFKEHKKIILDIENYRSKRENSLMNYARKMAKKAVFRRRNVKLEPMNPYERRIVHFALQDDDRVTTFSEGEDPNRRVVIALNKKSKSENTEE